MIPFLFLLFVFSNQIASFLKEKRLIPSSESYKNSQCTLKNNSLICQMQDLHFVRILFIYREKGREGEREGEKHRSVASLTPTGDPAHNPDMWPYWELNQQPFSLQICVQSIEPPARADLHFFFLNLAWRYVYWRDRGRVGEREHERETSLRPGTELQPRYVPLTEVKPATFWCTGWCSNQLNHQDRDKNLYFYTSIFHSQLFMEQNWISEFSPHLFNKIFLPVFGYGFCLLGNFELHLTNLTLRIPWPNYYPPGMVSYFPFPIWTSHLKFFKLALHFGILVGLSSFFCFSLTSNSY